MTLITRNEFAKAHNVDVRTVARWNDEGYIVHEGRRIHLEKSNALLVKNHPTGGVKAEHGGPPKKGSIAEAKLRSIQLDIEQKETDLSIQLGKYVLIDEAVAALSTECVVIKQLFLGLGSKVAIRLAGQIHTPQRIKSTIDEEVIRILNTLTADKTYAARKAKVDAALKKDSKK